MCMELQKTLNSQSNLDRKEQSWRHHIAGFHTILQNYSNQNSMVLEQKWTHTLMEKNREPSSMTVVLAIICWI